MDKKVIFSLKITPLLMQSLKLSNPFAPEPSVASEVWIQVLRTTCDVISFNSQGQLCRLTCAGGRDLPNHVRMSTI